MLFIQCFRIRVLSSSVGSRFSRACRRLTGLPLCFARRSDDSSESESDSDAEGSPTKRAARKTADWLLMVGKVVSVEMDTNKKKKVRAAAESSRARL